MSRLTLPALNALSAAAFEAAVAPLFENAPWITAGLASTRPFASLTALHRAALSTLHAADEAAQRAFLRGHPMLSPAALGHAITPDSRAEQRSAGLDAVNGADAAALDAANAAHLARHGIPFILAVRGASLATIHAAMRRRAHASIAQEHAEALREVEVISWLRLLDRVMPAATGGISTHVLDTVLARPAAGLEGELRRVGRDTDAGCEIRFTTDGNGRSATMLGDGGLVAGPYELRLEVAAYRAGTGAASPDRSFFPAVSVQFAVLNPEEHFHVPVLLSNGAYTTYRGS